VPEWDCLEEIAPNRTSRDPSVLVAVLLLIWVKDHEAYERKKSEKGKTKVIFSRGCKREGKSAGERKEKRKGKGRSKRQFSR